MLKIPLKYYQQSSREENYTSFDYYIRPKNILAHGTKWKYMWQPTTKINIEDLRKIFVDELNIMSIMGNFNSNVEEISGTSSMTRAFDIFYGDNSLLSRFGLEFDFQEVNDLTDLPTKSLFSKEFKVMLKNYVNNVNKKTLSTGIKKIPKKYDEKINSQTLELFILLQDIKNLENKIKEEFKIKFNSVLFNLPLNSFKINNKAIDNNVLNATYTLEFKEPILPNELLKNTKFMKKYKELLEQYSYVKSKFNSETIFNFSVIHLYLNKENCNQNEILNVVYQKFNDFKAQFNNEFKNLIVEKKQTTKSKLNPS